MLRRKYIKSRKNLNFGSEKLVFDVSQSLFSSAGIDIGTRVLLNSLRKNEKINYGDVLDLGCGYGVIGIFLKKKNPESSVLCTDRDRLALDFTKYNAKLNNCKIDVLASLDYFKIPKQKKFDLIVCNFPAKAGINAMKKFVYCASEYLKKEGIFSIVIVKELEDNFEKILRKEIEIIYSEKTKGYLVYHLKFSEKMEFNEDIYTRNKINFLDYKIKTAYNLPEFESLSFSSELILKIVKNVNAKEVVIINPNQGHIALGVLKYLNPNKINFVSRDLLSLEYSKNNLIENGFKDVEIFHEYFLDEKLGNLLIWNLNEKEEFGIVEEQFSVLKKLYSKIIISGKRNIIERLIKKFRLKDFEEKEKRGFLCVYLRNSL